MRPGFHLWLAAAMVAATAPRTVAGDLQDRAAAVLDEAAPLVEQHLGTQFAQPPRLRVLSPEAALVVFQKDLRPEVERRYPRATPGQRRTLLRGLAQASVRSAVARYSVSEKCLVLVPESLAAQTTAQGIPAEQAADFLRSAIIHEAVHALDDQEFDLAKMYRDAADREALRAVSMIIEGRAVHFGGAVARELGVPEKVRRILPGGKTPKDRRAWTFRLTYEQGGKFIAALVERGGLALAARAMREPPRRTAFLFHPERWPDGRVDHRPEQVLAKAFLEGAPEVLSELELRARYADLDGPAAAEKLLSGLTGGSQLLWQETNVAVLCFDSEDSAQRYLKRSQREVPAVREGILLARAAGPAAEEAVERLRAALRAFRK